MSRPFAIGLRTRIVISLAVVMALFILLTEVTVSRLVQVSVSRSTVDGIAGEDGEVAPDINAELNRLRRFILFYMITGAVLAIALGAVAITRTVVRPLSRVTRAVERVAQGELETEVPIAGSGEIIELGANFNRMTRTLREQREELGQQLEELERSSTNLREVQDSLVRAAKLASVGTLAAGVAHEIGNPIAGVLGLLDALEGEPDQEKRESYQALIRKEIQRIDRIISELLAYARPGADRGQEGAADLSSVLDNVRALLGAQRLFDRVTVVADLEEGLVARVAKDELTQLMINLFLNAAQVMEGNGTLTVTGTSLISWKAPLAVVTRRAVRITISDTGPGIPPELAGAIFDPFFSRRESGEGTGLGLAICQSICERAGGEITLETTAPEGARFVVTLPAATG